MKSLTSISTSAFGNCTINEFDAPNIESIKVFVYENVKFIFTVGKKNFQDSPGII